MKKAFCSLMVIAMLFTCTTNAFAMSATAGTSEEYPNVVTVVGEPIGTLSEEDSTLVENRASTANGLPFTMTAISVSGLLTTYNSTGKNFTGGAFDGLTGEGLLIEGEVSHSLGFNVKVGACYYKTSDNTFYSVFPLYFDSDVDETGFIPKVYGQYLYFNNSMTYYGHITNHNNVGTVSGALTFSVSTAPY